MVEKCAVCGQSLPAGVTAVEMHRRLDELGATAAAEAATKLRKELDKEFQTRLTDKETAIRKRAIAEAAASSRQQIASLQRKLDIKDRTSRRAVEKAIKMAEAAVRQEVVALQRKLDNAASAAEGAAKKAAKQAATETAKQSQKEFNSLKERSAKERAQHTADTVRLKEKVEELSQKLERQTSEQMGEMTEAGALAALKGAFPQDDIQRIDRGMRGADILQRVLVDGAEVGRIVYECKNTSTWQNEWLTKARGYRTQYQTQWVVIASRCFPRREKSLVIERGFPVIELRLIVQLAEVIRSAIIEIGSLRLTNVGRQAKAVQMFEYILGDHFVSRFRNIGEAVTALRTQQDRERQWHSEIWAKEARLYDEVDGSRREIGAQVRAIAEAPKNAGLLVIAGNG